MIKIDLTHFRNHPSEYIYYLAFSMYVFCFSVSHTMFSADNGYSGILKYIKLLSVGLVLGKLIVRGRTHLMRGILSCVTLAVLVLVYLSMDSTIPIFMMIMLFGAQKTNPVILAKIYLFCAGSVYLAALIASQTGIIEDRILIRHASSGDILRHSLGTKYVTAFAAIFFFMTAVYLYLKKDKINWKHYVVISVLTLIMNHYTDARLETLSTFALLFFIMLHKKLINLQITRFIMKNCVLIGFGLAFGLTFLYMLDNEKFAFLDRLMSERLSLTQKGIQDFGFSLFGKVIPMQGWGEINFDWKIGYFFLDSFFINFTLQYGILFMALFLYFTHSAARGVTKQKDLWLMIFVVFTSLHGVIISSIFDMEICPFFYIAYARFTRGNPKWKLPKLFRKFLHKA